MYIPRVIVLVALVAIAALGVSAQSAGPKPIKGSSGAPFAELVGTSPAVCQDAGKTDVLTDTTGFDFRPYLTQLLKTVRQTWYDVIPESVYAPVKKHGKVAIDFAVLKNGKVRGMRLHTASGDVSLDRAAWGGITASSPFAP